MGLNIGSLVDDAGRFFRGGQGVNALSEDAVAGVLAARRGVAPSPELVKSLAEEGAIFDGAVGEVIKGAPKGGDDLLGAIKDRIGEEMFSLVNSWKDRNFPKRLERALQQQEQLLPKLRSSALTQKHAVDSGNEALQKLTARVAELDQQAKDAVAKGDDSLASRLLGTKIGLSEELTKITERTQKYANDYKITTEQITTLEQKISIDRDKSQLLLSEWKLKRELKDLSTDAKKAMDDLNRLESDALANARQADQATKDAQNAVDDLLGGGGIRVPGGGTTPNVPGAPNVPIVDDAVQKELDRIKQELGKKPA
jgi:phage shock protein A